MKYEDRFTERAKKVINLAYEAAAELGHSYIGSEHILLGLSREGGGAAARILREGGLDSALIKELIVRNVGNGQNQQPSQGLTPRAKQIIELATSDAAKLGHNYVGTEHLLMGILREYDSVAARLIASTGVDLNKLYTDVINMISNSEFKPKAQVAKGYSKRSDTKTLDQFSRNLTESASKGLLDPVIGRDKEISRVIQILSRRSKKQPSTYRRAGRRKDGNRRGAGSKDYIRRRSREPSR